MMGLPSAGISRWRFGPGASLTRWRRRSIQFPPPVIAALWNVSQARAVLPLHVPVDHVDRPFAHQHPADLLRAPLVHVPTRESLVGPIRGGLATGYVHKRREKNAGETARAEGHEDNRAQDPEAAPHAPRPPDTSRVISPVSLGDLEPNPRRGCSYQYVHMQNQCLTRNDT